MLPSVPTLIIQYRLLSDSGRRFDQLFWENHVRTVSVGTFRFSIESQEEFLEMISVMNIDAAAQARISNTL